MISSFLLNRKFTLQKIIYIYILFLITVPNDVFEVTSIYSFTTPSFIKYDLYNIHFSFLYIPIIIYGMYCYINKEIYLSNLISIIALIFIKDCIYGMLVNNYMFKNSSYEMYIQIIFSLSLTSIVFSKYKTINELYKFLDIFIIINIFGLIISMITGIGTGIYGFEKRYHAPNLTHGETGFILSIYLIYLIYVKRPKYKYLYELLMIIFLVATGSRKDVLFGLLFILFDIINSFAKYLFSREKRINIKSSLVYTSVIIICICSISLGLIPKSMIEKLDIERSLGTLIGVITQGSDFIKNDYSGEGRVHSIEVGLEVIKENPMGVSFSFFESQLRMQEHGYPTFVHLTLMFYYIIMGPIVIIFIYKYLNILIKLIKISHPFKYVYLYFMLYNTIAGGAALDFKVIFIYIYILWIGEKLVNENTINKNNYILSESRRAI